MTEADSAVPPEVEYPDRPLITLAYMSTMKEVIKTLRAAETLGLGVVLRNYNEHEDPEDWRTSVEAWRLELYAEAPHVDSDGNPVDLHIDE